MMPFRQSGECLDSQSNVSEIITIIKGAGVVFGGTIAGSGLRYILDIVMAQGLGGRLFGLFFLGFAVFKVVGIVTELGLSSGVVRYVAIFHGLGDKRRIKGTILLSLKSTFIVGTAVAMVLFFLSQPISVHFFRQQELIPVLKWFAFAIPFATMTTIIVSSIQGFKIMKYRVYIIELFEPFLKILLVGITLFLGLNLFGVLFSFLLVAIWGAVAALYCARKVFPEIAESHVRPIYETRELFHFSWPLLLVQFMGYLFLWLDTLILGFLRTPQEVGIYGAAQRTALLSSTILASFNSIFAPVIADYYHKKQFHDLERLYKTIAKWAFSLTVPVCALMIFFSKLILTLFGSSFIKGSTCLVILTIGWLAHALMGSTGLMLTMSGRSRIQLINISALLSLDICLNLILIPPYGIMGAATATTLSLVFVDTITLIEVYSVLKIHPLTFDIPKLLFAGGISLLPILLATHIVPTDFNPYLFFSITCVAYLSIYFLLTYLLSVREDEKAIFHNILMRLKAANPYSLNT